MSLPSASYEPLPRSFPRVSGDEPQAKPGDLSALLFSPREWG